jgi:membrane protease YdiL (CAAX protease family)
LLTYLAWWRAGGFTRPVSKGALLAYAPWLILPALVLVDAQGQPATLTRIAGFAAFTLLVGFGEEGLLRGVVLRALMPGGIMRAALISSALFGAAHLTNMFQGRDVFSTVVQAIYATFIDQQVRGTAHFSGTIWPAVVLHALIDFSDFASRGFTPLSDAKPIEPGRLSSLSASPACAPSAGGLSAANQTRRA